MILCSCQTMALTPIEGQRTFSHSVATLSQHAKAKQHANANQEKHWDRSCHNESQMKER